MRSSRQAELVRRIIAALPEEVARKREERKREEAENYKRFEEEHENAELISRAIPELRKELAEKQRRASMLRTTPRWMRAANDLGM